MKMLNDFSYLILQKDLAEGADNEKIDPVSACLPVSTTTLSGQGRLSQD